MMSINFLGKKTILLISSAQQRKVKLWMPFFSVPTNHLNYIIDNTTESALKYKSLSSKKTIETTIIYNRLYQKYFNSELKKFLFPSISH
jgi:hypothetical protein